MAEPPVKLNALSCKRCKEKKVRCNRHMPQCTRCETNKADCVYPLRQKRRITKKTRTDGHQALSNILERLQRVEQHCDNIPFQPSFTDDEESLANTAESPIAIGLPLSCYNNTPSGVSSPFVLDTPNNDESSQAYTIDATSILKSATDRVEKLALRTYARAVITDEIRIPKETAKLWLKNYFTRVSGEMFTPAIDQRLMEMVPDLLEQQHVHLDASIIVIYYALLWQGGAVTTFQDGNPPDLGKILRPAYLGCLRALPLWQREATGTYTDMLAAISVCRLAGDCFDHELVWRMYRLACEYARALDLHNLDSNNNLHGGINPLSSEENRQGFWELISIDAFFRLLFNKPPELTKNAWKVNLPWLNSDPENPLKNVSPSVFIVSSRVSLNTLRFLAMVEEEKGDIEGLTLRTEAMCWEIFNLLDDWDLLNDAMVSGVEVLRVLAITDAALTGYTTILFMLRKLTALDVTSPQPIDSDADIQDFPVALMAARKIVNISAWALMQTPHAILLSYVFGLFRAHVAYAYVIGRILRAADIGEFAEDIRMIAIVEHIIWDISKVENEMVPLAQALKYLNEEIQKRVSQDSEDTVLSLGGGLNSVFDIPT